MDKKLNFMRNAIFLKKFENYEMHPADHRVEKSLFSKILIEIVGQ